MTAQPRGSTATRLSPALGLLALALLLPSCVTHNPAYTGPAHAIDDAASPIEDGPSPTDHGPVAPPDQAIESGVDLSQVTPDAAVGPDAAAVGPDAAAVTPDAATSPKTDATTDTPPAPGNVVGTIKGVAFPVAKAFRIGKPAKASTMVTFLLEAALSCADISAPLWDKAPGMKQVLEMQVSGTHVGVYQVGTNASANYLRMASNPEAGSGSVSIEGIANDGGASGTFDLTFGPDAVHGSFAAAFCATGVEP